MKKVCISVSNFYMKIINNEHTLLYSRPTIHSIQRYNGLSELIKYSRVKALFLAFHALVYRWGCQMLKSPWSSR